MRNTYRIHANDGSKYLAIFNESVDDDVDDDDEDDGDDGDVDDVDDDTDDDDVDDKHDIGRLLDCCNSVSVRSICICVCLLYITVLLLCLLLASLFLSSFLYQTCIPYA